MKEIYRTLTCGCVMLFISCSNDAPAFELPPNIYSVDKVYDIANNGNTSDIRVEASFSTSVNTADLVDVRLVIVKASKSLATDQINGIAVGNFFPVPISAETTQVIKPGNSKDSDGDAIVNGTPYKIYLAIIGKEGSTQLSNSMELTLQNKPIYAGDYVGTWEDLGPPGPASFPMSLRIADDYTGKMFYANPSFTPYGSGAQDATTTMTVTGTTISFTLDQFILGYSGGKNITNCPASKTLSGRFEDDVNLILETFNWADCDGTRDVKLKFKRK